MALADDVEQTMRASGLEPPIALDAALPVTPLSEAELAEPFHPSVVQNTQNTLASEQIAFLQLSDGTTGMFSLQQESS